MGAGDEDGTWTQWLRVYGQDDASWALDKDGRRIWFHGPPGKLYRKCAQKGCLQGKGRFTGALDMKNRPAVSLRKKPATVSKNIGAKRMLKQILKRPAAAAKRK